MAEGDTVLRWAMELEKAFEGRRILDASAPNARSPLRRKASRLRGLEVDQVEARGKHLIIRLHGGLAIHSHMGMSGSWRVYEHGQSWKYPRRSAWLILELEGIDVVQFGGPTIRLVRQVELGRDSRLASLGMDLLGPDFDLELATGALAAAGPMELGEALLDQHRLAGIGNIYKSEACFEAGMDPWRPVESFEREELAGLIEIARRQLQEGVETGRRPQRIYKMSGKPCPRCRARVRSRGQGLDNRITYWCPTCQK